MKTLASSCWPSWTSSTHLLPLALYHMIWRQPSSNLCWKSHHLTKNIFKNYCPISKLPFLSKILEKVVLCKHLSHLQENNLSNPFQSAYQAGHSTETVLLSIVNDIPSTLDSDSISVLLLLDLSATFDTIDHQILLSRLNSVLGIQSTALQWFQSYLSDRYQSTSANNSSSSPSQLIYCVPQGSVLGPILFVLYTRRLFDIIANHSVNHQLFAVTHSSRNPSSQWSDQPHQRTQCMHRRHKNMNDGKSSGTERRQKRSSLSIFLFLVPFPLPWNLIQFPSLIRSLVALTASPSLILPGTLDSFLTQNCPCRST